MKATRITGLIACVTLLAGMFSACGKEEQGTGQSPEQLPGGKTGHYVEREQNLPEEWDGWTAKQLFAREDKIHLLMAKEEGERLLLQEWEQQEDTFADVTKQWLGTVELPAQEWMELKLMEDGGGTQYLYAQYIDEGADAYKSRLWRSSGDEALEITPEKWAAWDEEMGIYEIVNGIAVLDNGTLVANSFRSLDTISGEDGSVSDSQESFGEYDGNVLSDGENIYLLGLSGGGGISQVEKRLGGKKESAELIPFGQGSFLSEVSLCVTRDGILIAAGSDGVFRCKAGETEWEKLLDGMDTDFALSGCWCIGLAALENGQIYSLFMQESGKTMLKMYEYDPNAVNRTEVTLRLYAVEESSLLQNAVALYHREHPEVAIEVEYAYRLDDKYSGVEYDYNEVIQRLNTMLMGNDAPDILVLDSLNVDSFIEKGLLADLNDVLTPMEQNGALLDNITGSYLREDGSRYIVPLQFAFSYITGRDIGLEEMQTMERLAAFLGDKEESYMGAKTVEELVGMFYPYFCDDIVDGKTLDKETLREKLELMKVIGDNCGIVATHDENNVSYGIWDLASKVKLALAPGEGRGFMMIMFDIAITDYIKGEFTAFENSFEPAIEMGICTKSQHQDAAKDFLRFALSEAVQGTDYYEGFPVNRASLEALATMDRSENSAATSIVGDDGSVQMLEIKPYGQETAQKLADICKALNKPYKTDTKIREVLIDALGGYLSGGSSLDETIDRIEADLKMYLAE